MNGFLLVVRMQMDDLPLRLFATREEIGAYLRTPGTLQKDIDDAVAQASWVRSTATSLVGVEFRDGRPVAGFHVLSLR